MPESEPKPKLIELVAPGAGQGWKATLRNGKAVVIHEIPAPAAEAAAAVPRIQRLAEHRHPALSPVLAWGTDPNGIWVAVEPNEGTPLGQILSRGPLTPPAAAALGASVLSGVAALHEAGIAMGGFGAAAIRVTGNGDVRLSGHPAAAVRGAPSQSDLRADVRSCGMAICAAFGVDPAGAPAPPSIPPGLVVTMRSMASGAMGPAADRAQGALREMASALLAPDRMTAAQSELALRAGGREMPSITPFLPKETYPPAPAPARPSAPQPTVAPQQTSSPQAWGAPPQPAVQPEPAPPSVIPPVVPIPAPFVPPTPKPDEIPPPRPSASYDAPPRPLETYPPNAPPPYVPPQRAPEAFPTVPPPIPGPPDPAPAPIPTWDEKPSGPPSSTWDVVETPEAAAPAPAPPKPLDTWDTPAAAATPVETPAAPPPPPPPVPAPVPEPPKEEARATWTAIPTPSWRPETQSGPVDAPAPVQPAPEPEPELEPEPVPAYIASVPASMAPTPPPPSMVTRAPAPAPPVRKPPAPRRPVYDQPTERPSWFLPAIAGVVILLLLLLGGGIYLAKRGGTNNPVATTSPGTSPNNSPKASPKASPSPTGPLAVPTYAPASADPIKSVQFCSPATPCTIPGSPAETNTSCNLTGTCHVEVALYFSKAQRSSVAFAYKFFDRCANTTQDISGSAYTPPGYTIVILEKNITIPSGAKSAALVAVSSSPSVAASAPLLMGSDSCT